MGGGPCLCAQPHSFMLLGLVVPGQLVDSESSCQLQRLVFFCSLLPDLRLWTQLLHHSLRFWPLWQQLLIVHAISCPAYQLPARVQARWMVESIPVHLLGSNTGGCHASWTHVDSHPSSSHTYVRGQTGKNRHVVIQPKELIK